MRRSVFLLLIAAPVEAHESAESASFIWDWEPWITVPLAVGITLYASGVIRLWRRAGFGAGLSGRRAACFAAGAAVLLIDLVSPLHVLADQLFFAHMTEHELMMAIAAPLIALARPLGVMLWGLPRRLRRALTGISYGPIFAPLWRALTRPAVATALHALAIWFWHIPQLFDSALASESLHALQHLCFLASALLFWSALFSDRLRLGAAVPYLFITAVHTSLLGAMLVFSQRLLYAPPAGAAGWNLTALEDQQLAGLVMWVPGGLVYAVAALVLFGLWLTRRFARPSWQPAQSAAPRL